MAVVLLLDLNLLDRLGVGMTFGAVMRSLTVDHGQLWVSNFVVALGILLRFFHVYRLRA